MDSIVIDSSEYVNLRIDSALSEILDIPRNRVQNYLLKGYIKLNDKIVKKNYKLRLNDKINLSIPKKSEFLVKPNDAPIDIVYEDNSIVVVNKPPDLVVHPGAACEDISVVSALLYRNVTLSNIGAPIRPGVVHRIDKDTSGIIVLAKTDRAHFMLAKQFFSHTIDRKYIGVVQGHLTEREGVVDMPIARHQIKRKEFCVRANGKPAKTSYKVLKNLDAMDVVQFRLYTGRTHQIRVHMKHIKHPLVGDKVYGSKKENNIKRQALHAFYLSFRHPETQETVSFASKLPYDILKLIKNGG
jgi:23S rRNA pseudouridine1911/1915/1917 synthase